MTKYNQHHLRCDNNPTNEMVLVDRQVLEDLLEVVPDGCLMHGPTYTMVGPKGKTKRVAARLDVYRAVEAARLASPGNQKGSP